MKKIIFISLIFASLFLLGCKAPNYDSFAKCLTDKGVTFYGAFWCPHCENQKSLFGPSIEFVNYIECSLPDKSGQTEICIEKEIKSYPTWEFADGSRVEGKMSILQLSSNSECSIGD